MSEQMTDLEITRACAEAMGWKAWQSKHGYWNVTSPEGEDSVVCEWNRYDAQTGEKLREPTIYDALAECDYNPLHDDAQAMALLMFLLTSGTHICLENNALHGSKYFGKRPFMVADDKHVFDVETPEKFRRAICLCVAKMAKEQA